MVTLSEGEPKILLRGFSADEVKELRKTYTKEGIITIPEFFKNDLMEQFHEFLHSELMPDFWWSLSTAPTPNGFVQDTPENKELLEHMWVKAGLAQNQPGLSFRFYRTSDHVDTCTCPECKIRKVFQHPDFVAQIKAFTGEDITEPLTYFTSRYEAGCFLGIHSDTHRGKCAFVLNLTKDWNPAWGGCLHFLEEDWFTIKKVITPKFNSLTLFHVPEHGIPHFVSAVSDGVESSRMAFSGWFK